MKRKIFSVLFALVLVLSFSLIPAMPASAAPMRNILFITNGGTLNTEKFDDDIKSAIEAQPGVTNIVTAAWPLPEHATDYDLVLLNDNTMLSDNPESPAYSYHQRLVTYLQTDNKTLLLTGSAVYWADNLKMSTFATGLTSNADDKIFKVENNHADILPGSFKNVGDVIDLYEQRACKYSFMSQEAGGYEFRGIVLAATSIAVDLTGYGKANGKLATVGYMDPAEEHTFYEEIIAGTGTTPGAKIMVIGGRYDKGSGAPGRPDHLALFDGDGKTLLWNALDWLSPPVLPNEVWVADTGNDSNPGTEAEPFATIQKGIDEVAEGGTINVAAGTYEEEITVGKNLTITCTATYTINGNVHFDASLITMTGAVLGGGYEWYVDSDTASIQDAIDAASAGDTINVAAGTYDENVTINKALILNGANAGVNAVTGIRGSESTIDGGTTTAVSISASNVVLDGFTITIGTKADSKAGGVVIANDSSGLSTVTVKNNIIKDISDTGTDTDANCTYGILTWGTTTGPSSINIQNNVVQNVEEYGICINDKSSNVTIDGNSITGMLAAQRADTGRVGVAIGIGGSDPGPTTVAITNNTLNTGLTGNGSTIYLKAINRHAISTDIYRCPGICWSGRGPYDSTQL